jgi:hypothetical protein
MASGGRQLRTASGGRGSRPPPSDGPGGRRTATLSGNRRAVGPLRPLVVAADGLTVPQVDGRQGGCPWDRRTRPDVQRTRPWLFERVTTLTKGLLHVLGVEKNLMRNTPQNWASKRMGGVAGGYLQITYSEATHLRPTSTGRARIGGGHVGFQWKTKCNLARNMPLGELQEIATVGQETHQRSTA